MPRRNLKKTGPVSKDGVKLGAVLVRHFPLAFTENAMKKYFTQFGSVKAVKISRSRKTGGVRPYAYVVFYNEKVAKIAAEAMDNYLMFGKLMRCTFLPADLIPKFVFRGREPMTTLQKHKMMVNQDKTPEIDAKNAKKRLDRIKEIQGWLSEAGLSFEPVIISSDFTEASQGKTVDDVSMSITKGKKKVDEASAVKTRKLMREKPTEPSPVQVKKSSSRIPLPLTSSTSLKLTSNLSLKSKKMKKK